MFGSLIFLGSEKDTDAVQQLIDDDPSFVEHVVTEITGPFKFHLEETGILYRVRFTGDEWLNIVEIGKAIEDLDIDAIHAVSDDTFIDVVSTSNYYDQYTDDPSKMAELVETFGFNIDEDVILDEYED